MKLFHRRLLAVLLGLAALHAQAAPYFASKDGGMIWDKETGWVWMRCSLGQKWDGKTCTGKAREYYFARAQSSAKDFNAAGGMGGFTDWVVPSITRLLSLRICTQGVVKEYVHLNEYVNVKGLRGGNVAASCSLQSARPTIDPKAFLGTPPTAFWSSSPNGSELAWYMDFVIGEIQHDAREEDVFLVRLVRARPVPVSEAALGFPVPLAAMTEADWKRAARVPKTSTTQNH